MGLLRDLLQTPGVEEVCELRSRFGFMAYHGGSLEEMTDVIAAAAAEASGSSYYGIRQPTDLRWHIPSTKIDPADSLALQEFLHHVDCVITVHGFGRDGLFTSLLIGGTNRDLAAVVAGELRRRMPAYSVIDDVDRIPPELRGLHPRNPVNLPAAGGVQIELPPRARGSSPLWWDWEGPGPCPHTVAVIDALAAAASRWTVNSPPPSEASADGQHLVAPR